MQNMATAEANERRVPNIAQSSAAYPFVGKVFSKDGTAIAFDRIGNGPPVILVDGALCYRGMGQSGQLAELLAQHLTHQNMRFSEYVVDVEERKVAVKGQAEFTWTSSGDKWEETFAYVLDFDDQAKVVRYQVWADSGAAYLARMGELERKRKGI